MDTKELKMLAEKATPGPWWIDSHGHMMVSQADGGHEPVFMAANLVEKAVRHPETGNLSHWPNDWDASFIATANPKTVLELIAENELNAKNSKEWEEASLYWMAEFDKIKAELECARGDLKTAMEIIEHNQKDADRYRIVRGHGVLLKGKPQDTRFIFNESADKYVDSLLAKERT